MIIVKATIETRIMITGTVSGGIEDTIELLFAKKIIIDNELPLTVFYLPVLCQTDFLYFS
jgi:hypothetical protein